MALPTWAAIPAMERYSRWIRPARRPCSTASPGLGGRRISRGRFSAGRAGQPVRHYQPGRSFLLWNGVQAGYGWQRDRALQLHWWGGRRISLRRFSAGRAGQPVWHDLWWRRCRFWNGVQADAGGSDDYDYAYVFAESVHLWAGSDLYRGGHFQRRCAT